MKTLATLILLGLLGTFAGTVRGELQVVPASEPARVFAGAARTFPVVWQNTGDAAVTAEVRMRLLQTSSATTTTLGEWPWKKLQVLPGQTVTERAALDFPAVKAETRFVIKWLEGSRGTGFKPVQSGVATNTDAARFSGAEQTGKMPVPLLRSAIL